MTTETEYAEFTEIEETESSSFSTVLKVLGGIALTGGIGYLSHMFLPMLFTTLTGWWLISTSAALALAIVGLGTLLVKKILK